MVLGMPQEQASHAFIIIFNLIMWFKYEMSVLWVRLCIISGHRWRGHGLAIRRTHVLKRALKFWILVISLSLSSRIWACVYFQANFVCLLYLNYSIRNWICGTLCTLDKLKGQNVFFILFFHFFHII